jgi:2-polyprenyl-3-methyl-5-hydroxy-6-metoxy-1,4-benzoquinol methylase
MKDRVFRGLAGLISRSFFLKRAAELWRQNQLNWHLPLTKGEKILVGVYLGLHDYSLGKFPPVYSDREATYRAEIQYGENLPGLSKADFLVGEMSKPFGTPGSGREHLAHFGEIVQDFQDCGVLPPQRLLELGCGSGWTAEFLAIMGYEVVATNLMPESIACARRRIASIEAKGVPCRLDYRVAPMESVAEVLGEKGGFDAVFVHEALHHAFDWREALASAHASLKPGGWLFLFNEPNAIHTLSSYRVARLSNTHEVGFWPGEVVRALREIGFLKIEFLQTRYHFYCWPFSLAAQRNA